MPEQAGENAMTHRIRCICFTCGKRGGGHVHLMWADIPYGVVQKDGVCPRCGCKELSNLGLPMNACARR